MNVDYVHYVHNYVHYYVYIIDYGTLKIAQRFSIIICKTFAFTKNIVFFFTESSVVQYASLFFKISLTFLCSVLKVWL